MSFFNSIDRHDRHVIEQQGVMINSYRGIMILEMRNELSMTGISHFPLMVPSSKQIRYSGTRPCL